MRSIFIVFIFIVTLTGCGSLPEKQSASSVVKGEALANAVFEGGDLQNAHYLYETLTRKYPARARLWHQLGRIAYQLGDYQGAFNAYQSQQKLEKKNCKPLIGMGKSKLKLGQLADAKRHFNDCLNHEKENEEALEFLAIAFDMSGRYEKSASFYKRALARSPDDPALRNNYALSLLQSGKTKDAVKELSVIAFRASSVPAMRLNLALCYFLMGDEAASRQVLALDLTPREMDRNIDYFRLLSADDNQQHLRQFLFGGGQT